MVAPQGRGAAIDVVADDDVVPGVEQHGHGLDGAHAGPKSQTCTTASDGGQQIGPQAGRGEKQRTVNTDVINLPYLPSSSVAIAFSRISLDGLPSRE